MKSKARLWLDANECWFLPLFCFFFAAVLLFLFTVYFPSELEGFIPPSFVSAEQGYGFCFYIGIASGYLAEVLGYGLFYLLSRKRKKST